VSNHQDDWTITESSIIGSERTGWRDWRYSAYHRTLCSSLGMCDVDAGVWLEYDFTRPVALIETKYRNTAIDPTEWSNMALQNLSDAAGVPFFFVRYYPLYDNSYEMEKLVIAPGNDLAKSYCATETIMSPKQYEDFLLNLRRK